MGKYRMYVDEVGNNDLGSSDNPNHRFLSLTGVIVSLDHVRATMHPQMETLKQDFFQAHPDEPVILHRKEMLNAKPPFQNLKDPTLRVRFNQQLLDLIERWDYRVITVCLDKMRHRDTYTIWRFDPYHYCLAVLMERYAFWLNRLEFQGDVMAESRGGKEDRRLKDSFSRLWSQGTDYVASGQFQQALTSKQLKVKPKTANISGLQLTDLLAHPSRSEILHENDLLGRPLAPFARQIIDILQGKYYQRQGTIYGKKFL